MSVNNRYSTTAIIFHWLMAILIFVALAMGLYMVDLRISPDKLKLYAWHKWIGVTVFVLAAFRLWWRLYQPPPPPPAMPHWQLVAANVTHYFFYALFFLIPISGWLFSSAKGFQTVYLGIIPLPDLIDKNDEIAPIIKSVHMYAGYLLGGLLALHTAAALKHQFMDKDGLMQRMNPLQRRK
ncbi:MAG: cytochrome b [Gammaproteobacteria bacterium]|nr:cytochrome b [Gammaproteobacteria bacterium]